MVYQTGYIASKLRQCGIIKVIFGIIIGSTVLILFLISFLPGFGVESIMHIDYDSKPFQSPIQHPLMGTDKVGRDVFKMIAAGSRSFFIPSLIAALVNVTLGSLAGSVSGYYSERWFNDKLITPITTTLESMPRWVLIVVVCAVSNANIYWAMLFLGLTNFPKTATLVKGRILQLKKEQFVEAAKELGLGDHIIIWRHLLTKNCRHILFGQGMHAMADAILVETTIRYLFYNVGPKISWGRMAIDGATFFFTKPPFVDAHPYWLWFFPTMMIVLTIAGFYILGDVLTKWYEAKDKCLVAL